MNNDRTVLHYAIVRALPDLLRGEMINFALLGAYRGQLLMRTSGVTRCLEGILNDSQAYACKHFAESMFGLIGEGFPALFDGKIRTENLATVRFLEYLHFEGLSGFLVDAPRSVPVAGDIETARETFEDLFSKLILPIPKIAYKPGASRSRARTVVNRIIDQIDIHRNRVLTNVLVKEAASENTYRVDFAYANGKATLGQTVDLDTSLSTQAKSTDHAIANIAELRRVLGTKGTGWINVVQLSHGADESAAFLQRLRRWGQTIKLPEDRNYFEQMLEHEAKSDVRSVLSTRGALIDLEGKGVELVVQGQESEPLIS